MIVDINRQQKGNKEFDPSEDREFISTGFVTLGDHFVREGMMSILERELERSIRDWEDERRKISLSSK